MSDGSDPMFVDGCVLFAVMCVWLLLVVHCLPCVVSMVVLLIGVCVVFCCFFGCLCGGRCLMSVICVGYVSFVV